MVQLLSRHVQEMADFVKVGRSYVTTRFVRVVRDYMADSGNIAGAHRLILSGNKSVYHRSEMQNYAFNRHVTGSNLGFGAPTRFSAYEDREGWGGASFTRNLINRAYLMDSALRQPFLTHHMQMLHPGKVICVDDSFKATKLIRTDGAKPFDCLFGLMGGPAYPRLSLFGGPVTPCFGAAHARHTGTYQSTCVRPTEGFVHGQMLRRHFILSKAVSQLGE